MKIDVPFYKSEMDTSCGPIVLKMVLEYFGEKYDIKKLAELERQKQKLKLSFTKY